jgi:tetratricopeptide (TPR) repeat protein
LVALSLALAISSGVARADDEERSRAAAREHYARGTSFFDLGHYDDAISEYDQAYQAKNEPSLLYNIAQANRLAGHAVTALRFYKVYLTKVPHAANRDEVLVKITMLEKLVEQQRRSQSIPPDQAMPPSGKPPAPPGEPHEPPGELHELVLTPPPPLVAAPRPGRVKRIAGLALAGGGLALLAGGVACAVLAKQASDSITRADGSHGAFDQSKWDTGKLDASVGYALLGVGGAAVAGGALLFALGQRADSRAHAALTPQLSPQYAGLALSGTY